MQSVPISPRLHLGSHVRACRIDDQVILLDLLRNKYLGIGGDQAQSLVRQVGGWPDNGDTEAGGPVSATHALTTQLLSQGLLTNKESSRPKAVVLGDAAYSLEQGDQTMGRTIGAARFFRFLRSVAVTSLWLRFCSLQVIAASVARRQERLRSSPSESLAFQRLRDGSAAFDRLRPFVFTAHEKCLQDSLALVTFLASEGSRAHWVIGVKTRPFGAHSWVQSGETVLNDVHENVRRYRPILVV
jgi:hypothetical protein